MSGQPYNFESPHRFCATGVAPRVESVRNFSSKCQWITCLALIGACTLGAAKADAGFTKLGRTYNGDEPTHEQILERSYGGDFVQDGVNFSNGRVSVTRLDDTDGSDQRWNVNVSGARALGVFSAGKQSFGRMVGGEYESLFDVSGIGYHVEGSTTARLNAAPGEGIEFARAGTRRQADGRVFSSMSSDNRQDTDHLVSYRVSGLDGPGETYVLFWEDKIGSGSDFDHNDLVVELRAGGGDALLIPLPPGAWMGLTGLAGVVIAHGAQAIRRRRRAA